MTAQMFACSSSHLPLTTRSAFIAYAGLFLTLNACAPHQTERPDATLQSGNRAEARAERLRNDQTKALYRFDAVITQGESACTSLCSGHTEICDISKRLCKMSDGAPNNERVRSACDKAIGTCRQVTKRLPQECWCR